MKKILAFVILGIFLVSAVSAIGITHPQPQRIELEPGQSSFFTLQVQADDFPLRCVPIIRDAGGLELAFNQEYLVEANQDYNIKPQVIVPKETGFGDYSANFCLECAPVGDVEGSKVIPVICNLPVTVNVVSDRTRDNRFDDTSTGAGIVVFLILLAASILLLAAIVFYLIIRKRRVDSGIN